MLISGLQIIFLKIETMWTLNSGGSTCPHWYFGAQIFNEMLKAIKKKEKNFFTWWTQFAFPILAISQTPLFILTINVAFTYSLALIPYFTPRLSLHLSLFIYTTLRINNIFLDSDSSPILERTLTHLSVNLLFFIKRNCVMALFGTT